MAATKTSKARTTKTATKAAEDTTAENGSTVEPTQSQPGPGSDEQSPVAGGGDNGDTQDSQAQPKTAPEKDTPSAPEEAPEGGNGPAAEQDTPPEPEETKRIAVRSIPVTFRRAGFQFGRTETILDVRRLTDEQLKAIQEEPRLIVRPVTGDGARED